MYWMRVASRTLRGGEAYRDKAYAVLVTVRPQTTEPTRYYSTGAGEPPVVDELASDVEVKSALAEARSKLKGT